MIASLHSSKQLLINHLDAFFEKQNESPYASIPFYTETLRQIRTMTMAGKMIRGSVLITLYRLIKPDENDLSTVLNAAAGLEILQTAILTHDDIIDNDRQRRGMESIFAQYIDGKNEEYGKSMGICVGDIAIFLAFQIINSTPSATHSHDVLTIFNREMHILCLGQMLDIDLASRTQPPAKHEILDMYRFKTARYTFTLPYLIAGTIADLSETDMQLLEKIGDSTGILFQIRDDELSLFGDSAITGKPTGNDIIENKQTFIRHIIMECIEGTGKEEILTLFGKKNISDLDLKRIKDICEQTGVFIKLNEIISSMKEELERKINQLSLEIGIKGFLSEMVLMVLQREK